MQERSATERRSRIDDPPVTGEQLRKRFALHDEAAVGDSERAAAPNQRRQILHASSQLLVERATQVRADARIREPARAREHERHREGEDEREPEPDRQPLHASRSR